jgi:hypothetical protein
MNDRTAYTYTVLRYMHDVVTGEFVNVGIVMYVPSSAQVMARTRSTIGRLRGVFPDLDRIAFVSTMSALRRAFRNISRRSANNGLFKSASDAGAFAREAVPPDDSSLQWSPVGSGLTDNPSRTFERIYERFVSRYDTASRHRRTDDDIWRPVLDKLQEHDLASHMQEKVITGSVDDIVFKHAWKNGQWNVYEPISFDLANADSIKGKAREWLGHLSAVVADKNVELFKPHFLIGAPSDPSLQRAYDTAVEILRRAPNQPEIFAESQVDELVAQIEDEVRMHGHDN